LRRDAHDSGATDRPLAQAHEQRLRGCVRPSFNAFARLRTNEEQDGENCNIDNKASRYSKEHTAADSDLVNWP
jgi:hypothetical protein